jgi:peptide deformylase
LVESFAAECRMKIVRYPHPSLRLVARPLAAIDETVRAQAQQMLDLMVEHKGLALAATQVELPFRMIVMNVQAEGIQRDEIGVYFNPAIIERKGSVEGEEGCLSFPELFQKIRRAKTVRVQAYNLKGEIIDRVCNDLEARVWQHEIDHLDGILFIDKMGPIARLASRSSLRKFEHDFKKAQERGEIPPEADIKKTLEALAAAT